MKLTRGAFVTFEGIEGAGKSTQIGLLCDFLRLSSIEHVRTAEPGGTAIGEEVRKILLSVEHAGMTPVAELLLYAAARAQHVGEVIAPALNRGLVVVCDRFSDSTMAYQGFGRELNRALIEEIDRISTGGLTPDLTILLDVGVESGLARNRAANKRDRLELEAVVFHERVRDGYHRIMREQPGRVKMVDGAMSIEGVSEEVKKAFMGFLRSGGYVVQ